jgi:hypothetical protein
MTKLCPRGKAAAKRKFKVYPSAYANAYASRICAGKIKDPSGVKRKDFKGRKPAMGGGMMNKRIGLKFGGPKPLETKMDQKKTDQTKKVKRLMTQPDAYDPEKRLIKGTKKTRTGSDNFIKFTTDQTNLKEAVKKARKENPGFRIGVMKPEDFIKKMKSFRKPIAGGGLIEATAKLQRQGLKGGGICKKGMNRKAVGKNS